MTTRPINDQDPVRAIIRNALEEDIGGGDITTAALLSRGQILEGRFTAKESGVVAGLEVAAMTFEAMDRRIDFIDRVGDGSHVEGGQILGLARGPGQGMLSAERVALNFLQRISGIATMTKKFVDAVSGTNAIILDTRKTAPGLRLLDRWAVRLGGGAEPS